MADRFDLSAPLQRITRRTFVRQSSLLAMVFACRQTYAANSAAVIAETSCGKIRGTEIGGIKIFKGVPYGASTAGKNRFMPPKDRAPWSGTRDALEYGTTAPQGYPGVLTSAPELATNGLTAQGEDCLMLNIWTPGLKDSRKRPVMVWLHGGGFVTGSGSASDYDGTNLARRGDVVVVTINHRLNVLGFTYLKEAGGDEFAESGDVGMLDIVHALRWVKNNIEQFGADPATVTIFGQSGGGRKVGTLLAMPAAKGLFHRAVIESGPTIRLVDRDQASRVASMLLAKLNLSKARVREIQDLPLKTVMAAYFETVKDMPGVDQMTAGFAPTMDGNVIPQHPFHPNASPVSADVPLMLGCTRTEMRLQYSRDLAAFSLNDADMQRRMKIMLGNESESMIDAYRNANPGASPSDIFFLIASDYTYGGPVMKIAERRAALGKGSVHLYYFRWETPVFGGRLKSPHTIEIPFVFDNVQISKRLTGGGADAMALANKVSEAWIAFAQTGDPNTSKSKLPQWTQFQSSNWPTMVFDNESKLVNDPVHAQREAIFRVVDRG